MDSTEVALHRVRVAHLRWRLAALDHARVVVAALEAGANLAEVVPDTDVQSGAELPWMAGDVVYLALPAGFDGASVRELGERYAVGEISEDQLRSQLIRWRARQGVDELEHCREVGLLLVDELIDESLHRRLQEAFVE
jgi:acetyl esterase/lipase